MEINLNSFFRRVRIEFFNIVGELPWIFLGFTVITAVLVSAGYDNPERLTWLSMSLSVLFPLAISIVGNMVVLREFSGNSYQFSMSRKRIIALWLWRLGMVVFSTALYITIILGAFNLFGFRQRFDLIKYSWNDHRTFFLELLCFNAEQRFEDPKTSFLSLCRLCNLSGSYASRNLMGKQISTFTGYFRTLRSNRLAILEF